MTDKSIFINGHFHTCDPKTEGAQAIVVENGCITQIGDNISIKPLAKSGYAVVDLKKKCVVPGLIDAHLHLLSLGRSFKRVNLDGIASLDKVKKTLNKAVVDLPANRWLIGRGWNKNLWGDDFPHKGILDEITKNPVALRSKDGHLLWVNSTALKIFGIDANSTDPPGGVIMKDSDGIPTGILQEEAAEIADIKIPKPSRKENFQSVKDAQMHLLKLGITGVGDCDGEANLFSIYNELDKKDQLLLRVFSMIPRDGLQGAVDSKLKTGMGSEHFRIGCLKLFADGALGSQTAFMFKPYKGSKSNYGVENLGCREIERLVKYATGNGISVAIHAIGDRANFQALCSIGKYLSTYKKRGLRPRVEHAQLLRKSDINLFKAYNIIASVQPIHATSDRDVADKYWGARSRYAYPFKTFLKLGAKLAFGSDAPIETANPIAGIHAAVTRKRSSEKRAGWYPEERLTPSQAIEAYTRGSSYACCYDDICGSISIGKRADLVILSDDIFEIRPDKIAQAEVLMTVIDGKIAYSQSD